MILKQTLQKKRKTWNELWQKSIELSLFEPFLNESYFAFSLDYENEIVEWQSSVVIETKIQEISINRFQADVGPVKAKVKFKFNWYRK